MSLEIAQLSNKLQRLDWEDCLYVNCDQSFTLEESEAECCICGKILKTSNTKNHALIGSSQEKVEEIICKVHYLCYKCKGQCSVCRR